MSCCSSTLFLGCFDYCSTLEIPFDAAQDGAHIIEAIVVNGVIKMDVLTLAIGDQITLDLTNYNEKASICIRIVQPDETYYTFTSDGDDYDCISLKTTISI